MSRSRRAFTIVELLVVISIIILLAALSIPSLMNIFKTRSLKDGARVVQMGFRLAQIEAQSRRRPVMVRFVPFIKGEVGVDQSEAVKITDVLRWRMELVDGDGDGDGVTDEDGDTCDFEHWVNYPSFGGDGVDAPDVTMVPPVGKCDTETSPGVWHTHPNPGNDDDKIPAEWTFELPDKVYPRAGKSAGTTFTLPIPLKPNLVFVFNANGSCLMYSPDFTMLVAGVKTSDFRANPASYHDFRLEDPAGEAMYFDIVMPTGIVNVLQAPGP